MDDNKRVPYRIVIGVDFEATGDQAIATALRLAREHPNSELHAVHVIKLSGDRHSAEVLAQISRKMEDAAKGLDERVHNVCEAVFPAEEWDQSVHFHVRVGDPCVAIHQVAVDYDADLLVVGTHARTGLRKLVLGSVAQKLIKIAQLPVLIAREKHLGDSVRSDKPDAAREGESMQDGFHRSEMVSFGRRGGHISGLL